MRDTSDMMEDAMSEDTMMDCRGDGGVSDLSDLTTDISDTSANIRVAAERLLNLLGVEGEDDDFLSSEDEGVELDIDDEDDDVIFSDDENNRLLQQLANSLAEELKASSHQQSSSPASSLAPSASSATQKYQSYHADLEDLELDYRSHKRLKVDNVQHPSPVCSWNTGWDACATEAVRYLMEEEGLAGHHPTVLALKNHLALQRNLSAYKT
ncbi:uncharacterized protein LOC141525869 [Cotesia typhae]|uniref:uncharacterized protein LOC141525869 n=1 Tax=Cotesia typhae TaxID=2053667 RepID=UPI003D68822D